MGKVVRVLHVGAAPESVIKTLASLKGTRVFLAEGDTALVNVQGSEQEAEEVTNCLVVRFGQDRVADASQVRPREVKQLR